MPTAYQGKVREVFYFTSQPLHFLSRVTVEDYQWAWASSSAMMTTKRTSVEKSDLYGDRGGRLNIFLKIAVLVYRHTILGLDISVFLIKALSEYIRLTYRSIVPRPLRDIGGDVVLVTGAGHGIGKELAIQMSKLGAIVLCVDKNMDSNR